MYCINYLPILNILTVIILGKSTHINNIFFIDLSRNILSHHQVIIYKIFQIYCLNQWPSKRSIRTFKG